MKTLILALMLAIAGVSTAIVLTQPAAAGGSKTGSTSGGFDG